MMKSCLWRRILSIAIIASLVIGNTNMYMPVINAKASEENYIMDSESIDFADNTLQETKEIINDSSNSIDIESDEENELLDNENIEEKDEILGDASCDNNFDLSVYDDNDEVIIELDDTEDNVHSVSENNGIIVVNSLENFESDHNYSNNSDLTWIYSDNNAAELIVTFSSDTDLELGADYISILDKDDNLIGPKYTGTQLKNKTIVVPYGTVKIHLQSDESTVKYGFKVDSIVAMNAIEVKTMPSSVIYLVGQEPDYEGLIVNGIYDDGITEKDITNECVIEGVDKEIAGIQSAEISYRNLKTYLDVTYKEPVIESISVKTKPQKTVFYLGEELDLSGFVLSATDDEENTYDVVDGYEYSGFDSESIGIKTITVTYEEETISFDVEVKYGFTYTISNGKITVTGLVNNQISKLVIPEIIESNIVMTINGSAFKDKTNLKRVQLPNTITNMGTYAFSGCSELENINFPSGITQIPAYAFNNCKMINDIDLPNDLLIIGDYAFAGTGITSIEVPNSVTKIGVGAFRNTKMVSMKLPFIGNTRTSTNMEADLGYIFGYQTNSTTGAVAQYYYAYIPSTLRSVEITDASLVASYAFRNCSMLTEIKLNEGIASIGNYAFENCSGIASLELPSTVTSIGTYVFSGCSKLENINIPSGITQIPLYAFNNDVLLSKITIPEGVTIIGERAFNNCEKINVIKLQNALLTIGDYAFAGTGITSIEVPNSVTKIGVGAFRNTKMVSMKLPFIGNTRTSTNMEADLGYIFGYQTSSTTGAVAQYYYAYIPSTLRSVEITDASLVASYAFRNCSMLTEIKLNEGIASIGNYAFENCSGIASLELPSTVTSIGTYVFSGCSKLENINIPSGITQIPAYAFNNDVLLSKITIPEGVTSIGNYAFNNCTNLKEINISNRLKSIETNSFYGAKNAKIYTKNSYVKSYFCDKGLTVYAYRLATLDKNVLNLNKNEQRQLVLSVYDLDGKMTNDYSAVWTIDNPDIISCENGKLITKNYGTAIVTVKVDSFEEKCVVNVTNPATSISIQNIKEIYNLNDELNITASVIPYDTDEQYHISSSDRKVVMEHNGKLIIVGPGTTTITARTSRNITDSAVITVSNDIAYSDIALQYNNYTYTYTGVAIEPIVSSSMLVNDIKNSDYFEFIYEDNINVGKKYITVYGKGKYSGTKKIEYEIEPRDVSYCYVSLDNLDSETVYSKAELENALLLKYNGAALVKDVDYTIEVVEIESGHIKVEIQGHGNFKGTKNSKVYLTGNFYNNHVLIKTDIQNGTIKYTLNNKEYIDGSIYVPKGMNCKISVISEEGYHLAYYSLNGVTVKGKDDLDLENISMNQNIKAVLVSDSITIAMNANGGYFEDESLADNQNSKITKLFRTFTYGKKYGERLISPVRDGYIFDGWYYNNILLSFDDIVSIRTDDEIVANWTQKEYAITFDTNGGKFVYESDYKKVVKHGEKYGNLPTPTRNNYIFEGWYYKEQLVSENDYLKECAAHMLIAKWRLGTSVVTFDPNGGRVYITEQSYELGNIYLDLPSAYLDGYTFDGWYTEATGGVCIDASSSVIEEEYITLYAHWRYISVLVKQKIDLKLIDKYFANSDIAKYDVQGFDSLDNPVKNIAKVNKKGILTVKKSGVIHITPMRKNGKQYEIIEDAPVLVLNSIKPTFKTITLTHKGEIADPDDYFSISNDSVEKLPDDLSVRYVVSNKHIYLDSKKRVVAIDCGKDKITAIVSSRYSTGDVKYNVTINSKLPYVGKNNKITIMSLQRKKVKIKNLNQGDKVSWITNNSFIDIQATNDNSVYYFRSLFNYSGREEMLFVVNGIQYKLDVKINKKVVEKIENPDDSSGGNDNPGDEPSGGNEPNPEPQSQTVYVTANGECYHKIPKCGNMKSAIAKTESEATAEGYKKCTKCF